MRLQEIPADEFEDVGCEWLTKYRTIVAPKTTGRRLTSMRRFSRWAGWGDLFADYSAPTPLKGQPHPLPEGIEGVYRMIDVVPHERHKALIGLCGLGGLRIAEALSVRATDFDLHDMTLVVRGKGDKQRQVPVSTKLWELLVRPVTRAYLTQSLVVDMKDRGARSLITNAGERAGLKRHVSSHDLRATFATEVYNKTLDQRLVQELLGHANSTQTEIYIGRSSSQLRGGVEL